MAEFRMPSLGADMDAGTVVEWLVKPGDTVHKGDIVAVVDTAKSAVEVETFVGGVVGQILVEPGQEVPVGTILATIEAKGAARPEEAEAAPVAAEAPIPLEAAPRVTARPEVTSPLVRRRAADLGVDLTQVIGTAEGGLISRADVERAAAAPPTPRRPRVSPYARRLAAELGVELDRVTGSGEGGTVRADDVRAAAAKPPPTRVPKAPPVPAERKPIADAEQRRAAMREAIARLMARSKREIPHYYLTTTVDLDAATTWLRDHNRALPVSERVVPAALLLKATALAAQRHSELNGFWVDDAFVPGGDSVHLGVAISLRGGGLVAPALHDAATLSVDELMAGLRDLVSRARAGRLRRTELTDPTITVTNLGDQGVESVLGVIYPPQVALVGYGKIIERPWAVNGLLGVRPVVTLTLSADHRATDGFSGARFLGTVDSLLQDPEAL